MKIPGIHFIKFYFTKKKWRKKNSHNYTVLGCDFPFSLVEVGKFSYGVLHVKSFNKEIEEGLKIGNYVSIAENVTFILGGNHNITTITNYPLKTFFSGINFPSDSSSKGKIVVEDEVWIGHGVIILSGVKIGKGAIIAAGSIISKDVPNYAIVGGNPARIIKKRFSEEIIEALNDFNLINYHRNKIKQNVDMIYSKTELTIDDIELIKRKLNDN